MLETIDEIWLGIHTWLHQHGIRTDLLMNEGASDAQIEYIESELSFELPKEIKQSWRIHDGQVFNENACGLIAGRWRVLSLNEILEHWPFRGLSNEEISLDDMPDANRQHLSNLGIELPLVTMRSFGPIKSVWWARKWLPIAYDFGGSYIMADLDPCPEGNVGQLILWFHDDENITLVESSYSTWLSGFAMDLESNIYVFNEKAVCLEPKRKSVYSFHGYFGWLLASDVLIPPKDTLRNMSIG
jgi:cell wall assembly regulator SMI1